MLQWLSFFLHLILEYVVEKSVVQLIISGIKYLCKWFLLQGVLAFEKSIYNWKVHRRPGNWTLFLCIKSKVIETKFHVKEEQIWVVKLKGCNILSLFYICCFMTLNFFPTSILGVMSACSVDVVCSFLEER